ncbi:MAG: prephenate dehydratase [bacterium]
MPAFTRPPQLVMHDWPHQLEALDKQLMELLNARCRLVGNAAGGIADPEQALLESGELERLLTAGQGPLSAERAKAIFREIQAAALELRQAPAVAYLGPSGTNTHQAALGRFGNTVHYLARPTIPDVFEAVTRNQAAFGVVPVENSTEGAVTYTLDMFADSPVKISAEINMRIHNHLIGSGSRERLRVLYSHPQVFGQCRQWLRRHLPAVPLVETFSTTEAAARAAAEDAAGAITGPLAAEQYRLPVMEANIEDTAGNTTRFFVIGTRDTAPTGNDKTSILFAIKDRVGALLDSLEPFRRHGISLSFIESRPSRRKSWDYHFFVDFVGHAAEPKVQSMLHDLGEQCQSVKILGSYPRAAATT